MSIRLRVVLACLAVFIALAGVTTAGYVYINHVAAGVARVPVLFVVRPSQTPGRAPLSPRGQRQPESSRPLAREPGERVAAR